MVYLVAVGQGLVYVARLIAQVEHHALAHGLVKLVRMDVAAKHLDAFLLVRFEQRRAGKADEHRAWQQRRHGLVQVAALGAVALVHKYIEVALCLEARRQALERGHEFLGACAVFTRAAKLVHQRADQRLGRAVELVDQVEAARAAADVLVHALEDLLDLLIELGAVGHHQHPCARYVLANPLGQPHHGQALAAALGVPNDAALAPADEVLRRLHAEVLVLAAELFGARIKHHKVVHQLQQAGLVADLQNVAVQQIVFSRIEAGVLHPAQVIFFLRLNGGVAQALAVVARHHPLQGREEGLDKFLLLVVQVLANALGHSHGGAFELQHAQRNAVDVEDDVRALAAGLGHHRQNAQVGPLDAHLLGNRKVVVERLLPVDEPDRHLVLTHGRQQLDAIAQQRIDLAVAVVQALAGVPGHAGQLMQGALDQRLAHALLAQPGGEQRGLDVAVVAVLPRTQIVIAQALLEQRDDAGLGVLFGLADGGHGLPCRGAEIKPSIH